MVNALRPTLPTIRGDQNIQSDDSAPASAISRLSARAANERKFQAQALLQHPPVQWLAPAPLWQPYNELGETGKQRVPALLRFASDEFMEEFLELMADSPDRMGEWKALRETWRRPAPTPDLHTRNPQRDTIAVLNGATEDFSLHGQPLKLYMPTHQRFYLVTAMLVCRIPGLPDKILNLSNKEETTFVVRRKYGSKEHALVGKLWQPVAEEDALMPGEIQYPLFPLTYQEYAGKPRRMLAGLIPVAKREELLTRGRGPTPLLTAPNTAGGTTLPAGSEAEATQMRIKELITVADMDIFSPWRELKRAAVKEEKRLIESWNETADDAGERNKLIQNAFATRDHLVAQSFYTLLDFAIFLEEHLPAVWSALNSYGNNPPPAGTPGRDLILALQATTFTPHSFNVPASASDLVNLIRGGAPGSGTTTIAAALLNVHSKRDFLESTTLTYPGSINEWPSTRLMLTGSNLVTLVDALDDATGNVPGLIQRALVDNPPAANARIPLIPDAKEIAANITAGDYDNNTFVVRCVYKRPTCPPGLRPAVLSEPTEAFEMAGYFDSDAPIRPIRIPMPIDTTPAGLRKHARNTMFVLSDTLACQIERARGLSFGDLVLSVLPWPFHKDLPSDSPAGCADGKLDFGLLCTLSLPIITICALILLIIIVLLLDLIFHWVPFLIFCLPLPGLKAKK